MQRFYLDPSLPDAEIAEQLRSLARVAKARDLLPLAKHYGPGDHPSGSPQSIHGGGGGGSVDRMEIAAPERKYKDAFGTISTTRPPTGPNDSPIQLPKWATKSKRRTYLARIVNGKRQFPDGVTHWRSSQVQLSTGDGRGIGALNVWEASFTVPGDGIYELQVATPVNRDDTVQRTYRRYFKVENGITTELEPETDLYWEVLDSIRPGVGDSSSVDRMEIAAPEPKSTRNPLKDAEDTAFAAQLKTELKDSVNSRFSTFREKYARFLTTGPSYSRNVATHFADAAFMVSKGRWEEADYWLSNAERSVEVELEREATRTPDLIEPYLRQNWKLPPEITTYAQLKAWREAGEPKDISKHGGPGDHASGSPQTVHRPGSAAGSSREDPSQASSTEHGSTLEGGDRYNPNPAGWAKPSFPPGEGTAASPFRTADVEEAARLLSEGYHVDLDQPRQVSTLLDRLSAIVKDAESKGEAAPNYDLCKVTVAGTNLFCTEALGIKRISMPQFSGKARPGSTAEQYIDPQSGEANVGSLFVEHLRSQGVKVEQTREYASYLRASQSELVGAKVAGIAGAYRNGSYDPTVEPIFISRDNYVVDGHHRWAAAVSVDLADNRQGDVLMNVIRLDMPIAETLVAANSFTSEVGLLPKAAVAKGRPFWGLPAFTAGVRIAKSDTKRGLVFGWASVAFRKGGQQIVDAQGHSIDADELEQVAYRFTAKSLGTGVNHTGTRLGKLVESVVFTDEKIAKMGLAPGSMPTGWWVGFQVPPEIQARVDSGELTMFSIQGTARLEPVID